MSAVDLVLRDGDRASARGRLLRAADNDWFEPSLPGGLIGGLPPGIGPSQKGAIEVIGADFDSLDNRLEHAGMVAGHAFLTGRWSDGRLHVVHQERKPSATAPRPSHTDPPCLPPTGGWPEIARSGDVTLDYDIGNLLDTGTVVTRAIFRPDENRAVLVVAATDEEIAEAWLRPQLGNSLCIVPSRWTKGQVGKIRDLIRMRATDWNIYSWGPMTCDDGQVAVQARCIRILPEMARWADSVPSGLLILRPWLSPLGRD